MQRPNPSDPQAQPPQPQPPQTVVIQQRGSGPGCLVQGLWFLVVGWWLGGVLASLAWFLNVTIVGLPLGLALLNNLPKALALQEPTTQVAVTQTARGTQVTTQGAAQYPFLVRAAFFLLIGWWWSGIWMTLSYSACATIILMPVGLAMFRQLPAMTTLHRY